jgi:two-component system alkaline phosphatase synthesis response regulator PhoP
MFSKRRRILVIDDEEDLCFFVRQNLKLLGNYDVITARNGKEGIRAARFHKPDLILLDIMMPGLDGFEVLKKLKEDKKTLFIPVIFLTAKGDEESKLKAATLYNDDYIVKPFEMRVLKAKIDNVLEKTMLNIT